MEKGSENTLLPSFDLVKQFGFILKSFSWQRVARQGGPGPKTSACLEPEARDLKGFNHVFIRTE